MISASLVKELKIIISSILLMNSGLKVLLNSCITSSLALSLLSKIYSLPRLDVIIMIVFLKSTVLP